jgi:hypothetical protein
MNKIGFKDNKITKTFENASKLNREISGTMIFGMLSGENVPQLMSWGSDFCVTKQVHQAKSCYELGGTFSCKNKVNGFVADFVSSVFLQYQKGINLPLFMQWEFNLNKITEEFLINQEIVAGFLGKESIKKLLFGLSKVRQTKFQNSLTIVHGDLHLDNILISSIAGQEKIYVIDFEHCMEAPLEMEFQNSLFWNDDKSLEVKKITETLSDKYGIKYSKPQEALLMCVYVANQFNLAVGENDTEKLKLLGLTLLKSKH